MCFGELLQRINGSPKEFTFDVLSSLYCRPTNGVVREGTSGQLLNGIRCTIDVCMERFHEIRECWLVKLLNFSEITLILEVFYTGINQHRKRSLFSLVNQEVPPRGISKLNSDSRRSRIAVCWTLELQAIPKKRILCVLERHATRLDQLHVSSMFFGYLWNNVKQLHEIPR